MQGVKWGGRLVAALAFAMAPVMFLASPASAGFSSVTANPANVALLAGEFGGTAMTLPTSTAVAAGVGYGLPTSGAAAGAAVTAGAATTAGLSTSTAGTLATLGAMGVVGVGGVFASNVIHNGTSPLPAGGTSAGWALTDGASSFLSGGWTHSVTFGVTSGTPETVGFRPSYSMTRGGANPNVGYSYSADCWKPSTGAYTSNSNSGTYTGTTFPRADDFSPSSCSQATHPGSYFKRIRFWSSSYVSWAASDAAGVGMEFTYQSATPATRTIEITITCQNPAGVEETQTLTVPVTESELLAGKGIAGLNCDEADEVVSAATRKLKTVGGSDVNLTEPYTAPDWVTDLPAGCRGTGICQLKLAEVTDTGYRSCFNGTSRCNGWATSVTMTQDYKCLWGPSTAPLADLEVVNLRQCSIYRDTFDPETPGVIKGTVPANEWPLPLPQVPGGSSGGCDLGWGDFLTGKVVYKAVTCALVWAFVPGEDALTDFNDDVGGSFSDSALGSAADVGGDVFAPIGALDDASPSCQGPAIDLPMLADTYNPPAFYPFTSCPEAQQYLVGFWMPLAIGMTYLAGITICSAIVLSGIGMSLPFVGSGDAFDNARAQGAATNYQNDMRRRQWL